MESAAPNAAPSAGPTDRPAPAVITLLPTVSNPTLSLICAIHNSSPDSILRNLGAQTLLPTETLVGMSGEVPQWMPPEQLSIVYSDVFPTKGDFGYAKRNELSRRAVGDWVGFMCQDDSYHPRYLELMMKWAVDFKADIVWCRWNDRPYCQWQPCDSTLGNFLVKRKVFLELGGFPEPPMHGMMKSPAWPGTTFILDDNHGFRDALFIQKSIEAGLNVVSCPFMLYYHNVPFLEDQKVTGWGNDAQPNGTYRRLLAATSQQLQEQR